ncbi:hypothetical protein SeLEV6574_g05905 [Synchytrium endobioticum]|uniref:Uncharacterized protein n=1 Tax=Synchytrium endobioticum TaxID=286115 RepID=A0A507CRZ8_9FUNG|nr:hypothetical protein SeLEV6574_g05905 [Synchytrium endobioticum]
MAHSIGFYTAPARPNNFVRDRVLWRVATFTASVLFQRAVELRKKKLSSGNSSIKSSNYVENAHTADSSACMLDGTVMYPPCPGSA